jgi:adenylate cyclase
MRRVTQTGDTSLDALLGEVPERDRGRLEGLLERLEGSGVSPEETRQAILENRLHLLVIERVIAGAELYSANEIAAEIGVDAGVLAAQLRAVGLPLGDLDERVLTEGDLDAARRLKTVLDLGVPARMLEETTRVMAMALAQVAASNRAVVADLLPEPDGEPSGPREAISGQLDMAEAGEGIAGGLIPLLAPTLEHIYKIQVREQLRHVAINADSDGRAPGVEPGAVAFADLVGFTRLGERLPPEEYGEITQQFAGLAAEQASGPVRLVKMIGDAAMFTAPDPEVLADAVLGLLEAVDEREDEFPSVRAGLSWGDLVARAGDYYGRPVNLASRLQGAARPGSMLVAAEDLSPLEESFHLSDAGHKRLKGIEGRVHVFRCRRPRNEDEEPRTRKDDG